MAIALLLFCNITYLQGGSSPDAKVQSRDGLTIISELSLCNSSVVTNVNDINAITASLAIKSWLEYANYVIALVDNEKLCIGLTSIFPRITCHTHYCNHHDLQIPIVSCLMITGESHSHTDHVLFVNSDIIFANSIQEQLDRVKSSQIGTDFVITGTRTDIVTQIALNAFTGKFTISTKDILNLAKREGISHGDVACDYFLYPRKSSLARKMPPFILGNWRWDNWLLHEYMVSKKTKVIDASDTIVAVHIGNTATPLVNRPGAVHNSKLYDATTGGMPGIGLGSLKHADYRFHENGKLVENTDFESAQQKAIFATSPQFGETMIVVTVPCGYLDILKNWLTWIKRCRIQSFIIFAMDKETIDYVKQQDLPLATPMTTRFVPTSQYCLGYNKYNIEKFYIERNIFLKNITTTGIGFLSITVNSLIVEPMKYAAYRHKDIFGQRMSHNHRNVVLNGTGIASPLPYTPLHINDGFWGTSTFYSRYVQSLLQSTIECQNKKIQLLDGTEYHSLTNLPCNTLQQESIANRCLNEELKKGGYLGHLSYLGDNVVSGGTSIFVNHHPLRLGIYPGIIHQDIFCSYSEHIELIKKWNLWIVDEIKQSEQSFAPSITATASSTDQSVSATSLVIRIIVKHSSKGLSDLLKSLSIANYASNDIVDLELIMDYPNSGSSQEEVAGYHERVNIAKSMMWTHGEKRVVTDNSHLTSFDLWIRPFIPRNPNQAMLLLSDDVELSPSYYSWCKVMIQHLLTFDDPNLFGSTLYRQHSMIALKPDQRSPETFLDKRLEVNKEFYRYQLLGNRGTIFLAKQWNGFVEWAKMIRDKDPQYSPCIPYYSTNAWYNHIMTNGGEDGNSTANSNHELWSIWFNHYSFMNGKYSLNINYAHYEKDDGRSLSLIIRKHSNQQQLQFLIESPPKMIHPPSSHILFDFNWQYIPDTALLKDRWRYLSGIPVSDRCIVNHNINGSPVSMANSKGAISVNNRKVIHSKKFPSE